ncbi:MAG: DoxX family protein [Novosphingobium sp.]
MQTDSPARTVTRWLLGLIYLAAGAAHLANPEPFVRITPHWVPAAPLVILLTGMAELAGAAALVQPWSPALRRAAGWAFATYALCVWPANINHMVMDLARPDRGLGLAYHLPRMALQPVLIWAALWASGVTGWPFAQRNSG